MSFNSANHYWAVAGNAAQVYSSRLADYVVISDPTYQAWLAQPMPEPNHATSIASEAELGEVLAEYALRPTAAGVLDGYTTAQAGNIVAEAIFKILFNHENRIRTIERALSFNGSPANLTQGQAKAAVKALL